MLEEADIIAKRKLGVSKTVKSEPFEYGQLVNGKALRNDLYFMIMEKKL